MTVKILLPVDGSGCSLRAVEHLIGLVAWLRAVPEIHLVHVHPPIPISGALTHVSKETLTAYYRDESEAQMADAKARLEAVGLAYTPHIHIGQPAEVLVRMAEERCCDLVVMGTHGRSALAGLLAGSVASRVLHLAKCPVLLIK